MEKFSKLKSFFKNPIKKNPAEEFVKHFDAEVFNVCSTIFRDCLIGMVKFSPKGLFKVHINGQEVFAKTGEIAYDTGDGHEKRQITSFVFPTYDEHQIASRYIEFRSEGQPVGIGNVWHRSGKSKTIFLYESKYSTGFGENIVSLINIAPNGKIIAMFKDMNDEYLCDCTITLDEKTGKNVYDLAIAPHLLGLEKDPWVAKAIFGYVGNETVCHPITLAQKLYKENPQMFKHTELFSFHDELKQKEAENEK